MSLYPRALPTRIHNINAARYAPPLGALVAAETAVAARYLQQVQGLEFFPPLVSPPSDARDQGPGIRKSSTRCDGGAIKSNGDIMNVTHLVLLAGALRPWETPLSDALKKQTNPLVPSPLVVLEVTSTCDGIVGKLGPVERSLLPESTRYYVIQGGNHAGFGSYNTTDRAKLVHNASYSHDGVATISRREQRSKVVGILLNALRGL